jgi:hypothetical protein
MGVQKQNDQKVKKSEPDTFGVREYSREVSCVLKNLLKN